GQMITWPGALCTVTDLSRGRPCIHSPPFAGGSGGGIPSCAGMPPLPGIEGHAQAAWLGSVCIRVASIFSTFVIVITIQFTSLGALHGGSTPERRSISGPVPGDPAE